FDGVAVEGQRLRRVVLLDDQLARRDPSSGTSLSLSIRASLRTRWRSSTNAAWIEIAVPGSPSARQAEQTIRPDRADSGVFPVTPNRFS
ncbi:hypothetical protein, partial [Mesorhizobium sp. M7A.F.Ca.CA.001.08.1.1]|uniref:hypothetical protein n=1 Tax=Mesorhizobium sp. M7A.F.Ca.CA.001.08.1.1 TaxID=2496691 RepID=UPI0019D14B72